MFAALKNIFSRLSFIQKLLFVFIFTVIFHTAFGLYYNSFGQDIARDLVITQNNINKSEWIISYGPKASVGDFYLPPLYYQVHLVLSLVFNNAPFVMKYFVIIVESLTPVVLVLIFKVLKIGKAAWGLALFYAIFPLVTLFSSFAWNPNTIPFFSTLALYSWLKIIRSLEPQSLRSPTWEATIGVVAVMIAFHFHYQSAVLVPFMLCLGVVSFIKQKSSRSFWLLGILISIISILPYLLQEVISQWSNTHAILEYFSGEHSRYYDRVSKINYVITFFPEFIERVTIGTNLPIYIMGRLLFFLGGACILFTAYTRRKENYAHIGLVVYLISIVGMLRFYKGDKLDYYLSTLYILPILLLAYMYERARAFFYLILVVIIVFSAFYYVKVKPLSQYSQLKNSIKFITTEIDSTPVRYIFHNDDDINTYIYGFSQFGQININQNSLVVVDICDEGHCEWDGIYRCVDNRGYTYSSLLKSSVVYKKISTYEDNNRKISIGEFESKPKASGYKLYLNDLAYGTDTLYPELYQQ